MKNIKAKIYTLEDMKNRYIGERGTVKRDAYEYALRLKIIEEIKKTPPQYFHHF